MFEKFSFWIPPEQISGLTFLDIGCREAYLGEYLMMNGAKEYLGIDIELIPNNNLNKYTSASIQQISAEDFLKDCKRKFDVVFCNNVIIAFSNLPDILKQITQITDNLIIESPNPYPLSENFNPTKDLEYNCAYMEVYSTHELDQIKEENYLGFLYSMGFLKTILNRLGFVEDLSCYEQLKLSHPSQYGFGLTGTDTVFKKFVIKFSASTTPLPITWAEWVDHV
jgi:L-fucose isomerase-like protein